MVHHLHTHTRRKAIKVTTFFARFCDPKNGVSVTGGCDPVGVPNQYGIQLNKSVLLRMDRSI